MGNLGSIVNMFRRIGHPAQVTNDLETILNAQKILLPGVGAFDAAMERINGSELRQVLDKKAKIDRIPILGICLGMQLLTNQSDEGKLPGLGWIQASTKRFPSLPGLKIPHMGWNLVSQSNPSELTINLPEDARFYFVHSYYVQVVNPEHSILRSSYGTTFDSAIRCGNIYGAQFHPEKSHKFGMQLLSNFAKL